MRHLRRLFVVMSTLVVVADVPISRGETATGPSDTGSVHAVDFRASEPKEPVFAEITSRWNGAFLWAPASASRDTITRFGDEARAVFGPIPDGDCSSDKARILPLQVDGNLVDLKPNPHKEGHPLEFEHRDATGNIVKWTTGITQCDKPSLAGSAAYCGLNSRLHRVEQGNVDWLFLCRKSSRNGEVEPTPYWQRSNPKFALYGVIGFNRLTGETAFFDGRKDRREFDWTQKLVPPGGRSYDDDKGRAAAEALYDPTFQVECSACHDNKSAYVITPSIQQARVGFLDRSDPNAIAFSLGNLLPKTPRSRSTPFRVIGSGYTGTYRISLERASTVSDPTGNCTQCHTLTTQVTGQRFAADAVAKAPTIIRPTRSQFLRLKAEQRKLREINAHRTIWATRTGAGKIHPWMVPVEGNSLSTAVPEINTSDWSALSNCLWGAGGAECNYKPLYTPCPIPGASEQGDISEPVDFSIKVLPVPLANLQTDRVLRLGWKYLNSYGGVPQRDDVRFNVVVKSVEIPNTGAAPFDRDYPGRDEADDRNFAVIAGEVGTSGEAMFIRNVSFLGHSRFTEPKPSTELRAFQVDLPARCNRRYLVRVMPKRFCFDQTVLVYGRKDYVQHADISCPELKSP
ncbi:hypothetical protein ASG68_15975 [Rhizobium sp. Leaf453]|nr:hypothetical protein ASG50_11845 [Rhizobium sp. Leaf386]KQS89022.1 hypothetical protein ASG42_14785 [Rhizobium sp. Leaf391]KQT92870.1 hypothetical protein ASG68_15975 [Rhizobium sp. Leaf453]